MNSQSPKTLLQERRNTLLLLLLTIALPYMIWYYASWSYDETVQSMDRMRDKAIALRKIASGQMTNRTLMASFRNKDSLFLQKYVETYPLLQNELKERESDPFGTSLPTSQEKKDRMRFLTSGENTLSFVEGKVQQSKVLKETLELQNKAVEVDNQDLNALLLRIEGSPSEAQEEEIKFMLDKRPLLFIENAEMERKKKYDKEVWSVKLRVLKREFIQGTATK